MSERAHGGGCRLSLFVGATHQVQVLSVELGDFCEPLGSDLLSWYPLRQAFIIGFLGGHQIYIVRVLGAGMHRLCIVR